MTATEASKLPLRPARICQENRVDREAEEGGDFHQRTDANALNFTSAFRGTVDMAGPTGLAPNYFFFR